MPISRDEVAHVATLARLGLSESEVALFAEQLGSILDHMESLGELDVSEISPIAQVVPLKNVMRADVARPSLPREAVLSNAPRPEENQFRVAAVFDEA